ncbi:hypothetical protein L9F63_023005 [Diploptera punctata]|uniref:UDP-glucuronosyltransferase n=1 Tax=Diploptera punctata TaxID=6984 RepID=A0AAD7ZL18_DIPPU|nr:hypothetical protein L9F63_023005 [Diploptera punctata]
MQRLPLVLVAAILSHVAVNELESAKILGLFHLNSRSHFVMFEALLRGLASRGHEVYVVSHFPQEQPLPNYTDISLKGTLPELVNNFTMEFALNFRYTNMIDFLWYKTLDMCQVAFDHPNFKSLLSDDKQFDLIITEIVGPDCFLGLKHLYKCPVISMTSSVSFPWGNDRLGNPDNPAYIPNYFVPFSDHMTFTERFINFFITQGAKLTSYYFGDLPAEKMQRKYFKKSLPPISELQKEISILFVNSHFSLNVPRPAVPGFIEVGGLHIQPGKELPQVFKNKPLRILLCYIKKYHPHLIPVGRND